jgi:hypothetical protein
VCHLAGSANGLAAAYFLLQHKNQLGGSRHIWKVRIFLSDDEEDLPDNYNLLFYTDGTADPAGDAEEDGEGHAQAKAAMANITSTVVERSRDGNSLLRKHVFRARI